MKSFLFTTILIFSLGAYSQNSSDFFYKADVFFSSYVSTGLVNYEAIEKKTESLIELIALSNSISFKDLDSNTQKAFWINLYNIITIKSVIENLPIKSPLDVVGFFDTKKHEVVHETLTLNDIENNKIRRKYDDPRIHFVLVCAGLGCPPIINSAYLPKNLDSQLEKQTRLALNNPKFIQLNHKRKKVAISEIFKWYLSDFASKESKLIDYINIYREEKIPTDYKITYYTYDWSLNKVK
ncbi:DUF547 domain-containing protein [Thalassobellus sediminis]|uniref:DUF547 domain-containing protein n=1 Tax=Thalassobellus sediminis TaxID=3367753 RepID=UPI0037B7DE7B